MKNIVLCLLILMMFVSAGFCQGVCDDRGDDLFSSGPCCTPITLPFPLGGVPMLPSGGINMQAQWASIANCGTVTEEPVTINVQMAPARPNVPGQIAGLSACDEFRFLVTGANAGGTFSFNIGDPTRWTQTSSNRDEWILGKYTRTWEALDDNGLIRQYYRFLISGDINFTNGVLGTQVPRCTLTFTNGLGGAALMNGYIDISCQSKKLTDIEHPLFLQSCQTCVDGPVDFQASLVMTHYIGCQSHLDTPINVRSLLSGNMNKHSDTSYHLVAPNNFNFSQVDPSIAAMDFPGASYGSIRSTVSHTTLLTDCGVFGYVPRPGPLCLYDMPQAVSSLNTFTGCLCGDTGAPRYYGRDIGSYVNCGGVAYPWYSTEIAPEIPSGYTEYNLGTWNSTARYDVKDVSPLPILGTVNYLDNCDPNVFNSTGSGVPCEPLHLIFGIRTFYNDVDLNASPPVIWNTVGLRFVVDTLIDFGNHETGQDRLTAGAPAWTNIVWTISEI